MRLNCPLCGDRDRREFTWQGDAGALKRPLSEAPAAEWDAYVHLRDNPAGRLRELWYHDSCGTWAVVERDTVTHEVFGSELAEGVRR